MNRAVRRATLAVADATTEGISMVTVLVGAALGAWAGHTSYPATWPSEWRIAVVASLAVAGAAALNGLAELFLAVVRRRIIAARHPLPSIRRNAPAAPATLGEGLAQVAAATEADAAARAASAAFTLDEGDDFLRCENRWQGFENGEASYYLAPGVVLHYATTEDKYGRKPHFTLLTGDGDQPVTITSIDQIRHLLAARAAGLPAAPVRATRTDDVADDLTGLHTV